MTRDAMIYLDHNSTTPLLDEVAAAMAPWRAERFGNPASQHAIGRRARRALEDAREEIGRLLGADLSGARPDRVLFTSGGTEANNLAMLGALGGPLAQSPPGEVILSPIEHPSVTGVAELLDRRGWTIHRLSVSPKGVIEPGSLDEQLCERTQLVCAMLANNETGVLQPVAEIARRCQAQGVPLHTDAAQIAGKLPVDFRGIGVSTMSVAAHKFHGPLGIGALVIRHDVQLEPLIVGGFQQEGLRGGTESVALAVGMHAALAAWEREQDARIERMSRLRDELERRLTEGFDGRVVDQRCRGGSTTAHDEHRARGRRPAGPGDGARSGGGGLFHGVGLCQRIERALADAGRDGLCARGIGRIGAIQSRRHHDACGRRGGSRESFGRSRADAHGGPNGLAVETSHPG